MDNIIMVGNNYLKSKKNLILSQKLIDIKSNKKNTLSYKRIIESSQEWNRVPNFSKPDIVYPKIEKFQFSPMLNSIKKKEKNASLFLKETLAYKHNKFKSIEDNPTNKSEIKTSPSNALNFQNRIDRLKSLPKLGTKNCNGQTFATSIDPSKGSYSSKVEDIKHIDEPGMLIRQILKLDCYNRYKRK